MCLARLSFFIPAYLLFGHSMRSHKGQDETIFQGALVRERHEKLAVCGIHLHAHKHKGLCLTKLGSTAERKNFHGYESSKVRHMK